MDFYKKCQIVIYIPVKCFDFAESPHCNRIAFWQKIFHNFYSLFPNTLNQYLLDIFLLYSFGNPIIFLSLLLGYALGYSSSLHGLSTQILWKTFFKPVCTCGFHLEARKYCSFFEWLKIHRTTAHTHWPALMKKVSSSNIFQKVRLNS